MPDWTKDLYVLRYHWKWVALLLLLVVGSVLLARLVWATTVISKSLEALVADAEVITVGTVVAVETEWAEPSQTPFTFVTFSALDVLKGDPTQPEITVRILGGPNPEGERLHIVGVPTFHLGDRMVVFIAGNETQAVPFVGMWQGVYHVTFDPVRETETVATHSGVPLTTLPTGRNGPPLLHDGQPATYQQTGPALTLDAFRQSIVDASQERSRHVPQN